MLKLKEKSKVFVDANCLVAAALSPAGGSFALIQKSIKDKFELYLSEKERSIFLLLWIKNIFSKIQN